MKFRNQLLVLLAFASSHVARGEDIDLFVGAPPNTADLPNVLFIIDNTANWNQAFANEMGALATTFDKMSEGEVAKFNVGIMLATETGSPNNNIKGGYVRAAFRPMTSANAKLYAALIRSLDKLDDKGDGGYSALTMAEAYRYITSGTPYAGNLKVKTDYAGNKSGSAASNAIYALPGNALDGIGDTSYDGSTGSGCAKTFIIYISNGPNQQNASTDTLANNMLQDENGNATQIPLSPTGSQSNPSDEWARFMLKKNIVTFTIDVNPEPKGQGPGWTQLLMSMSRDEQGNLDPARYAAVNSASEGGKEIGDAVGNALAAIQDVNSVFASVSLPLSVNAQGTYLNQVYVGLFRPDKEALPRWAGNLKQYKLGVPVGGKELRLLDSADQNAINSITGFVAGCARSYWTPTATNGTYWSFRPQGTCIPAGYSTPQHTSSDSPDGNVVEKGAQAFVARNTQNRVIKTCSPVFKDCSSLTSFDTGNSAISKELLGAADDAEAQALIEWARGVDIDDENKDQSKTDVRASVHADVVHSRPVALNFGTSNNPQVVVFYGGNDGVFRAINGNRSATNGGDIAGVPPGGELWSFMPPEFYPHIKRLRDNQVKVSFPNVTTGSPLSKPYGIDGAVTAFRADAKSAWIYASMRRGGRAIYAFHIADISKPNEITLQWKKGCPSNFAADGTISDVGCSTGHSGIGQTWSQPKVIRAAGYSDPLLIVGGGYDTCEDADPATCSDSAKGSQVLVVNAVSGDVVATLDTKRSVIAEVAVVPDSSGLARHAYAVDLGGFVYRILVGDGTTNWDIKTIASLGCDSAASSCARKRKFMFAPDVVLENDAYVLLLGSGDREKPRNYADPTQNYFFMFKDKPQLSNWLGDEQTTCGAELICLDSLLPIATSANPTAEQLATKKGWYLVLRDTEQVVTSAITIFGTVTFSTHLPDVPEVGLCKSDLGTARVYNINYMNAASENGTTDRSEELPGEIGLPPSPVAGAVELDNGELVPFCIGCDPESPLQAKRPKLPPSSVPTQPKSRVYWYIQR